MFSVPVSIRKTYTLEKWYPNNRIYTGNDGRAGRLLGSLSAETSLPAVFQEHYQVLRW